MGLYDRDYARPGGQGPSRRPGSLVAFGRGLSAVQWLVIINVAVFMIDALIGAKPSRQIPTHMGTYMVENAPADTVVDRSITLVDPGSGSQFYPVRDRATGAIVGQWRFQRMLPLESIGHFSTAKGFIGLEVWRFVTFQFLHAGTGHLVFNMLALWFFGPLVEQHLRSKRIFLAYYLVCGICGAILYLILNLAGYLVGSAHPLLLINDVFTPLIGASAGVFGVLMASAYIAGDAIMLVFFVLPLKVRTGAYLMFLFALGNLIVGGSNAGGDAAHVGGAIAGFFFIRRSYLLADFFAVGRRPSGERSRGFSFWKAPDPAAEQQKLDAILDKVQQHGVHSLSASERRFLQRQTERRRGHS
jgi:membrane associated rhomboid family serine protease